MDKYQAIAEHISRARIERSVVLAELLTDGILAAWNGAKSLAMNVLLAGKVRRGQVSVFTFDA